MALEIKSPSLAAVKEKVAAYFHAKNYTKNQFDEYEKACLIEKIVELEKVIQNKG